MTKKKKSEFDSEPVLVPEIQEEIVPKKSVKKKPVIKTTKVRLKVKDSVVGIVAKNGYVDIPDSKLDILERRGIIKREK